MQQSTRRRPICPMCQVPATSKHIIWLCKWHHGKGHQPLPLPWTERVHNPDEDPLWARGWINKEVYEHDTGAPTLRGHGLWQNLEAKGYVVSIDAAPTTYDARSQGWVFAICIHTLSLGRLQRVAAITGLPPGKQSKTRALYYGMHVLAQHTQQNLKLVIPCCMGCLD